MTTTKNPAADQIAAAWQKWQRAIEKYANPLIKPSTAKRYLREGEKAKAAYLALKGGPIE